jgi:hypothetical protein
VKIPILSQGIDCCGGKQAAAVQIHLNPSCFWRGVRVFNHLSLRSAATFSFPPASICQKGIAFIIIDVFFSAPL